MWEHLWSFRIKKSLERLEYSMDTEKIYLVKPNVQKNEINLCSGFWKYDHKKNSKLIHLSFINALFNTSMNVYGNNFLRK